MNIYDWEQRKWNTVMKINSGKDYKHLSHGEVPVYGTGGYMLSVNEALSNVDSIGIGRKGTIDKSQYLAAPFWTVDTLFYMTPLQEFDIKFLYSLSQQINWKKLDESTGVPSLSKINIEKITQYFPNTEEQLKIGEFFDQLENTIALHRDKLDKLKNLKKAYLQVLFPSKDSKLPSIRFANFTESWEQRKGSDIFKSVSDKNHPDLPILSASQEKGMILRDNIGIDIKYDKKSLVSYKKVIPEQFVIHLRSFQGGFAYSLIEGITSPAYTVIDFRNKEQHSSLFWKFILSSPDFIKRLETVTYGIRDGRSISYSDFSTLKFNIPTINEQENIERFLNSLDKTIALHQQKLNKLKELKKAFLNKIFV